MSRRFLILDDNEIFATTLARALTRRGFEASVAHRGEDALQAALQSPFDYVTVDLHLEQDSGLLWITPLRTVLPAAKMLVLTGYASIATAVKAVKLGADDYLGKPANIDSILIALKFQSVNLTTAPDTDTGGPLSIDRLQWEHIQRVLAEHHGNISSTARALNMHRRTLQRKLGKKPVSK